MDRSIEMRCLAMTGNLDLFHSTHLLGVIGMFWICKFSIRLSLRAVVDMGSNIRWVLNRVALLVYMMAQSILLTICNSPNTHVFTPQYKTK